MLTCDPLLGASIGDDGNDLAGGTFDLSSSLLKWSFSSSRDVNSGSVFRQRIGSDQSKSGATTRDYTYQPLLALSLVQIQRPKRVELTNSDPSLYAKQVFDFELLARLHRLGQGCC